MRCPVLLAMIASVAACHDSPGAPAPDGAPADAAIADGADPDAGPHTGDIAFQVLHYQIDLDLATRDAVVGVRFQAATAGNCLTIGFRPAAAMAVAFDGQAAATATVENGQLRACDPEGYPAGATAVLSVQATVPAETWASSDVGFIRKADLAGGTYTSLISWIGGCDRHGPCDARPGQFPTYTFVVHHDAATQVLCPGEVTSGETETTCNFDFPAGPTYSTYGLMARSPAWTLKELGDWGGIRAVLYDVPGSRTDVRFPVTEASGILAWLSDRFGAFPYGRELRFVVGPTYWAGFEHPGNIALSQNLATGRSWYSDGLIHTTLHEIVHQWAGDQATLRDTYDFVWKEAMAEYLSFVYEDEHMAAGVADTTAAAWKVFSKTSRFHLVPDERPPLLTYYGDVYGPGPLILFRQLEVMYSRAAVLEALDALIGTGEPRALSVADVEGALSNATNAHLGFYFTAWVHGTGAPAWPRATVTVTPAAPVGRWTVGVSTTTADGVARGCAFTVRVTGGGQSADLHFSNGPDGGEFTPQTVGFEPTDWVIDPRRECLVYDAREPTSVTAPSRGASPWTAPFAM